MLLVYLLSLLTSLCHVDGSTYYDKVYCPQVDPVLTRDAALREELHRLRREVVAELPVYERPVFPADGVPPADVLARLWPDLSLEERQGMTLGTYTSLKQGLADAVQERLDNLEAEAETNTTNTTARRKRAAEATGQSLVKTLPRSKRQADDEESKTFESLLVPLNLIYGIEIIGGELAGAKSVNCSNVPTAKVRKELSMLVAWTDELADLTSDAFKSLKMSVEEKMDTLFMNDTYILADGYAGATILGVYLDELGAGLNSSEVSDGGGNGGSARRKREAAENGTDAADANSTTNATTTAASADNTASTSTESTAATTTELPAVDRVKLEMEIVFAGRVGQPAPKRDLDSKLEQATDLGITGDPATDSDCKGSSLSNLNSPSFMKTTTTSTDLIPSGLSIFYTCVRDDYMLPLENDPESDFQLSVQCNDGRFEQPVWPSECLPEEVCTNVPDPAENTGLERVDDRSKFRVGSKAYFACTDPVAVLDDNSGMNVFELECGAGGSWASQWPKCVIEPTCSDLPVPTEESRLVKATPTDTVKVGEMVVYECIERNLFHETPDGPEFRVFCGNSSQVSPVSSWPECVPQPCICLGHGLDLNQSLATLETSCHGKDAYDLYIDVNGLGYTIPRRFLCGTFKPDTPTWENRCQCPGSTPKVFWNEMEISTMVWTDELGDASHSLFVETKENVERTLNTYYLNELSLVSAGYLRTLVVGFERGSDKPGTADSYVKVMVEHQFRADSSLGSTVAFRSRHDDLMSDIAGVFKAQELVVVQPTTVTGVLTCDNDTLSSLILSEYVLQGASALRRVGEKIYVACAKDYQKFRADQWDEDPDDNTLTIRCKPNQRFDVPNARELPRCRAQCSADKPVPAEGSGLVLNTALTSPTETVWEKDRIWYHCANTEDGLAELGPDGQMEGSQDMAVSYECDDKGFYEVPMKENQPDLPLCLKRPKRCQCLGDLKAPETAARILDLYCRRDSPAKILPSLVRNSARQYLNQTVPSKVRCGSLDPVEVTEENACSCSPTEGQGADAGFWMKLDIYNLPFTDNLFDPHTEEFTTAKHFVEKALDDLILFDQALFDLGFVRTIAMRFEQGHTNMSAWHETVLAGVNQTNVTSIFHVDDLPGTPIVDLANISAAWAAAAPDRVRADPSVREEELEANMEEMETWTTIVEVEVQFVMQGRIQSDVLRSKVANLLAESGPRPEDEDADEFWRNGWASRALWVNVDCLRNERILCKIKPVDRCSSRQLSVIFIFDLTHSNVADDGEGLKADVAVGSTVNLYCQYPNERITLDVADDNPDDFLLTVLCKPDRQFLLPDKNTFPLCRAWCPAEKPVPPPETGLLLSAEDDNAREYLENANLTYVCNDTSLGVDASNDIWLTYRCMPDEPTGRYNVPRENETWPACIKRTTTIRPPILLGVNDVLKDFDDRLIDQKTRERYLSERNAGDEDYSLTVLVPCLLLLAFVVLLCLCCTRVDNPLCKYCSKNSYY